MSTDLRKSINKLYIVAELSKNKKLQRRLLREFSNDPEFLTALFEIVISTINRKVPLNESQLENLRPHINLIRKIATHPEKIFKKSSTRSRAIEQSGGFLPILVPTVASLLLDFVLHKSS